MEQTIVATNQTLTRIPGLATIPLIIATARLVSFEDRSNGVRWSLDIRYCDSRRPTGRDQVPGFIARSVEHPEGVTRDHLEWLALFES